MGEAIITRAGTPQNFSSQYEFVTEIITENTQWLVPEAHNQEFSFRIFGGGGGGTIQENYVKPNYGTGGGGGWMNNDIIKLSAGSLIPITIGFGGMSGGTGGSTFVATILSANGGTGGTMYGGGNGGSGGGASKTEPSGSSTYVNGGIGYQFGGGGASGACTYEAGRIIINGGNGGNWGGGGAAGYSYSTGSKNLSYGISKNPNCGHGARSQSNNGLEAVNATNGVNTIGIEPVELAGDGSASSYLSGGGGYGGRGGNYIGGGGGYGANGGNGSSSCAGGGGGYGISGYGGSSNGIPLTSSSNSIMAGGGGAYGRGSGILGVALYGGGGAAAHNEEYRKGANGICIIQYYKKK